jgi:hypothetical protein
MYRVCLLFIVVYLSERKRVKPYQREKEYNCTRDKKTKIAYNRKRRYNTKQHSRED